MISILLRALPLLGLTTAWKIANHQEVLREHTIATKNNSLRVIPGGSPFSFCPESRPTDLYNISSVELWPQPLHIDDMFQAHIYGTYLKNITVNATMDITVDCGSHCKDFGLNHTEGETDREAFCDVHEHNEQLQRKIGCPPVEGYALTTFLFWVPPLFFHVPTWYNFTFDAKTAQGERIYCITSEVCLRWENEEKNKIYHNPGNDCKWPR